jgi:LmbE family N-acetylglucosaminyl deacetylase
VTDLDAIERALVICAHPDDVDFVAAGTVAALTARGASVSYCIVTDGDAGGFDPSVPRDEIGSIRRREQTAAANCVGVTDLVFLGYPDGYLESSLALRRDLARQIRRVKPQVVICQSGVRNYERVFASHPDHLAAGEAALCAVYPDSRNEFWMPELLSEGYEPWTVPTVWVMAADRVNHHVDITDHMDTKMLALRSHESQHPDPDAMEVRVRAWMAANAQAAGLGEGRYAESFLAVETA